MYSRRLTLVLLAHVTKDPSRERWPFHAPQELDCPKRRSCRSPLFLVKSRLGFLLEIPGDHGGPKNSAWNNCRIPTMPCGWPFPQMPAVKILRTAGLHTVGSQVTVERWRHQQDMHKKSSTNGGNIAWKKGVKNQTECWSTCIRCPPLIKRGNGKSPVNSGFSSHVWLF